ncbi:endoplasmic reticulum-Golgi intermediate compartment protein 2-like [Halichoeres trimaculatus]|uniref:endoplasmic reticulum-Golgi intermediate compartment protein 2-like n=1 Tax=Halichoeres trimaculatus TaxID=147232 RepID=UPI003D9F9AA6
MRRWSKRKALTLVKEIDAFPKVPETYVESSASGGTVSLLAFTLIAVLAILEFFVYRHSWMKYEYEVDKDFTSKLRINIDITVAMDCRDVGADVTDRAESTVVTEGLTYEPANFELTPEQRSWRMALLQIQDRQRVEYALQDVLYKAAMKEPCPAPPPNDDSTSHSACRIHGQLYANKVAGNFHIVVGKSITQRRGHVHLDSFVNEDSHNFSHRIDHLSFGEAIPGIIHPLDGTEKTTPVSSHMFQYFITIVPTKLNTYKVSADTHQFSVTEQNRVINPLLGRHGVAGIFMKYDISSLMVKVTEQHMPFWKFLVRLCGIIGGIFSTTGMLHSVLGFLVDVICCRFRTGSYKHVQEDLLIQQTHSESVNFDEQ